MSHRGTHFRPRYKEVNPIDEYRPVKSTREISIQIADILEAADPLNYPPKNRAQTVTAINDVLQRRGDRPIAAVENELKQKGGEARAEEISEIIGEIDAYIDQKYLLRKTYLKGSHGEYRYKTLDPDSAHPLKVIDQRLYDRAAKSGFPPDFFNDSYFDGVTFYCLPDYTNFRRSSFRDCTFAVCRIKNAVFEEAAMNGCEFHSCPLEYVSFYKASLADTHFYDCGLQNVSFHEARLKSCITMDCTMGEVNYLNATLNGCLFSRADAYEIRNLHTATITMGGATREEANRNRMEIYGALRPQRRERQTLPARARGVR